MRIKNL